MTNHYHLVLETPRPTLGDAMREINGRYAQLFNERQKTGGGRLFEDRFGSKPVQTDEQFAQLLRYVARNPVAAGLCASPSDWKWSSHAVLVSPAPHPLVASERVDDRLAIWGGRAGQRYATLFEPHGPLAHIEPDVSPWKLRPTLAEIVATSDLAAAIRRARRHGYTLAEVATVTGLSTSTISREARRRQA